MPRVRLPIHHAPVLDNDRQVRQVQIRASDIPAIIPIRHRQQRIQAARPRIPLARRLKLSPLTTPRRRFALAATRHNLESAGMDQRTQLAHPYLATIIVRVQNLAQTELVQINARSSETLKRRPTMQRLDSLSRP